ncbi:Copper amine oxidase 1 [Fusarium oxysporum f. sp. albedinis]|nr:Copper amine oxidase 1 [Fusarium oxysporum f. sp. albedinis]
MDVLIATGTSVHGAICNGHVKGGRTSSKPPPIIHIYCSGSVINWPNCTCGPRKRERVGDAFTSVLEVHAMEHQRGLT